MRWMMDKADTPMTMTIEQMDLDELKMCLDAHIDAKQ
jgi:hypothetical protein